LFILLALIIGQLAPGCAQSGPPASLCEVYVSPNVQCHQGYAFDGANHYTFGNHDVFKWQIAPDGNWLLIASNTTPFAGVSGLNHLGDGDYFDGKLYVVAETWVSCGDYANQSLLVFDAASLARLEVHNVSAQHNEVSGLAVAPRDGRHGIIYVTSYCDGSQIFEYDLRTFEYLGSFPLSQTLSSLQGVAWHDGRFYVPEDGGAIYTFTRDGRVALAYRDLRSGSHEGLKFVGNGIRWLIDEGPGCQRIHYIAPAP